MLTPEQLEKYQIMSNKILAKMQQDIMDRIIQGIRKAGEITSSTEYLIFRATELGMSKKYIQKKIQENLDLSNKEIRKIYEEASKRTYSYDKSIFDITDTNYIPYEENEAVKSIMEAFFERTNGEMINITKSMGFAEIINGKVTFKEMAKFYQEEMDRVFTSVYNGTSTVDKAVREATAKMSNSGLRIVDYASGNTTRIDVAVRRNIMTGLTQMQEQITQHNAEELGTTIFEFSWHSGFRPSHGWGGLRYDTTGKDYPTKEEVYANNGGGTMDDYNCRHSVYPTFKEVEPAYSKAELKRLNALEKQTKEWNGKQLNRYEQTQKQRQMEAKMRELRRRIDLLKQNGDIEKENIQKERIKYRALMNDYVMFSKKMGLSTQKNRIYQDMLGRV